MTADGTRRAPTAPRQRNPRGQGQILREQLVEAATDLLASLDSSQALTLRMVARQVGVAPASVYSHFADLGALVEHVLRLRYDELAELMGRAAERASTPVEDLVGRCAAYLYWGTANPGHYRVVFGGRAPSDVFPSTAHEAGAELLAGVVAALAAASAPRARQAQAAADDSHGQLRAGLLLWAGLHGIVTLHNDRHNAPWPPLDELLVHLIALHTGQQPDVIAEAQQPAISARFESGMATTDVAMSAPTEDQAVEFGMVGVGRAGSPSGMGISLSWTRLPGPPVLSAGMADMKAWTWSVFRCASNAAASV